jgi:DNA modification methylase
MEQTTLPGIIGTNQLYCGDCLNVLDVIPNESFDLIYIDPPFYSQRSYEMIWGEDVVERFAFEDRWAGGINHYVNYLLARVRKMCSKLKDGGSFYLHLDWHISHYMKVELDKLFGYNAFQNEIIWSYRRWPSPSNHYQRMHDTILFYSKSRNGPSVFNVEFEPNSPSYQKRFKGKTQMLDPETRTRKITLSSDSRGLPRRDVWDISIIAGFSNERQGYPTQKPVALLERIVRTSTNPGDMVLDAYCGCGTTLAAAQTLGRRWVGIDISQSAIRVVERRLRKLGAANFEVHGLVKSIKELRELGPFEFQNWAINAVYGQHSPRKVADMGIDGFTFMEHHPIQVKQQDHVGRPVIDNLAGVLQREKEKRGMIIAFGFTSGAVDEVARLEREDKIKVDLIKCSDLVAGNVPFKIMV